MTEIVRIPFLQQLALRAKRESMTEAIAWLREGSP